MLAFFLNSCFLSSFGLMASAAGTYTSVAVPSTAENQQGNWCCKAAGTKRRPENPVGGEAGRSPSLFSQPVCGSLAVLAGAGVGGFFQVLKQPPEATAAQCGASAFEVVPVTIQTAAQRLAGVW